MNKLRQDTPSKKPRRKQNWENVSIIFKDILNKDDIRFILLALKNKFKSMGNKENYGRKLNHWFNSRKDNIYKTDAYTQAELRKDKRFQDVKRKQNQEYDDKLLNDVIEMAVLDLLDAVFNKNGITVIKTSDFDDITGKIDYIIIGKYTTIGLDITLTHNPKIVHNKKYVGITTPKEYNIFCCKRYKQKDGKIIIPEKNILSLKRYILPLEPNLMKLFVKNYIYGLCQEQDPSQFNQELIINSRNNTLDGYGKTVDRGIYKGTPSSKIKRLADQKRQELLNILSMENGKRQEIGQKGSKIKSGGASRKRRKRDYRHTRADIL